MKISGLGKITWIVQKLAFYLWIFKGYLCYKMITPQNVLSEAQVMSLFFYFVEKLCSIFKIFKFLYF